MAKQKYKLNITHWQCPDVKCGSLLTIETDIIHTRKARCSSCNRIMNSITEEEINKIFETNSAKQEIKEAKKVEPSTKRKSSKTKKK